MLKQLRLKYFQRHEDLTLDFDAGLVTMRAPNEGGKSTTIRGILYALYGSRALPASLSSIVTWGREEKDLRAELDIEVDGKVYTFTRAKSGAEVVINGQVFVTGQNEVSNFAAELLGADLNTANRLMVANQGNLRGALESGPKAAAEMVESLADFELFDKLLERAAERLTLGSDAQVRQRLEEAEEHLAGLDLTEPDTSEFAATLKRLPNEIATLEAQIQETLKPKHEQAVRDLDQALNNRSTYDLLNNNLKKVQSALDEAKTQQIAAQGRATPVDTSKIEILQARLASANSLEVQRKVFEKLGQLNAKYPETVWEDTVESLQAEIDKTEAEIETLAAQAADKDRRHSEIASNNRLLQQQIQKDDHCGSCGQLLKDHKEIAKRNAALEKEISEAEDEAIKVAAESDRIKISLNKEKDYLKDLKAVMGSANPYDSFIRTNAQYVEVDSDFVPPKITWKGPEPSKVGVDTGAIEKEIDEIKRADAESRNAQARVEALGQSIAEYTEQVAELTTQIQAYKLENVEAFREVANDLQSQLHVAQMQVEDLKTEMREAETQIRLLEQAFEQRKRDVEVAQNRIEMCKRDIKELAFNNALVKRLRELRPVVANQLWNMVLAAVSTMFSTMRCQQSVVTRDKDGFKVNGESIDTLSGSTLDLLGMSIRVALLRTFIPNCPFLILDEPFAAADSDRAQQALGFLQTLEIPQVLLITHEDLSELVSDNLITLEG